VALVGLGYSLWRGERTPAAVAILDAVNSQVDAVVVNWADAADISG